jgi:hypothetical protein
MSAPSKAVPAPSIVRSAEPRVSQYDWETLSGDLNGYGCAVLEKRSHYRTGLNWAIWVTSVRMRREDQTSISSHPLADLGGQVNAITCERSRSSLKLVRLEGSTVSKNAPRDARELVGKGDGEHVVMQPLLGGLDPRPEAVALRSGRFHFYKNDHAACEFAPVQQPDARLGGAPCFNLAKQDYI